MKATEAKFLDFLKRSPQFIIPIYQRTYSWTETECRQLWDDIIRTGKKEEISAHFVGSIVYIEKGLYQVSSQTPLLVIDGQQRLTTVSLIIEALARNLGKTEPMDGFSATKLRNYFLRNMLEEGERSYKLLLTQTDEQTLKAMVGQTPLPVDYSLRLKENFEFFEGKVKKLGKDLTPLCKGLAKLVIVDISLSRDQDNPQLIFESMNSTGRELSQADLIRNFILMGLEPEHQTRLYRDYWRPMEVRFGQEAYDKHFDGFVRHYLTLKTGEIPNVRKVYEAFKAYTRRPKIAEEGVDALMEDVRAFADFYCAMALGQETNSHLSTAFSDLRELKVAVAYPFLLELYHDYSEELLSAEDFEQAVRLVESYVFRRSICSIPTNSLNKTFSTFGRALKKDHYLESIKAHLLLLPSYRRFPNNEEFRREIKRHDLYNFRNSSYCLRRLENYDTKERSPIDDYTIEHILPQNENLSQEWRESLGPEWKQIQETWLHTLGNLTLTGYNAEYSDRPFVKKQAMKGGFKMSPLRLNKGLGELKTWNEETIKTRAERLSVQAAEVWPPPTLQDEVLDGYRPKAKKVETYSMEDHTHLIGKAPMRPIFDALRQEVIAIDTCVHEEIRKLYIAFKAETNFVDVVPQAKNLRLSLNMEFFELHDPKRLAKDVTNIGRWGNGDVELKIKSHDEIPYAMGLIRQAFEKQMNNTQ